VLVAVVVQTVLGELGNQVVRVVAVMVQEMLPQETTQQEQPTRVAVAVAVAQRELIVLVLAVVAVSLLCEQYLLHEKQPRQVHLL
jgi:hypothetical protein